MKHVFNIFVLFVVLIAIHACQQPTSRMENFEVHGIDVSHYQSKIDWDIVSKQGIHFGFVKATEGISLNDSIFCHNWSEMQRVGIKRGAYHFFYPNLSAHQQAKNFIHWVEMEYGDLPPVLDVEILGGVSQTDLINNIQDWLSTVEIHFNIKPILYTNLKFYNKYLAGHFDEYPIWIARYNKRKPILACGRDWQFWQYGNRGKLSGILGSVDFNVFSGSYIELEELCLNPQPTLSKKLSLK